MVRSEVFTASILDDEGSELFRYTIIYDKLLHHLRSVQLGCYSLCLSVLGKVVNHSDKVLLTIK
jgi:hypothetical protein